MIRLRALALLAVLAGIAAGAVAPCVAAPVAPTTPAAAPARGVPAYQAPTIEGPDPWATLARVAVALAVVVALVLGTQRALARAGGLREDRGAIRVREVRRLGPQHTLYVIETGGRRLLLGANLTLVAELGDAEAPAAPAPFAARLRALSDRLGQIAGRDAQDAPRPAGRRAKDDAR